MQIGVIEGFFGPQWPQEKRLGYAPFLQEVGADYYIYAPKQDPHLRKAWRDPWDEKYLGFLRSMVDHFHSHNLSFGVALSPFGLGETLVPEDMALLAEKVSQLRHVGIDRLGVFFDDMPVQPNLARVQAEAMAVIQNHFAGDIVFCPTFYCFDPILEKVFGKKPEHYLEDLSSFVPSKIDFVWTGPKVISTEVPFDHLTEVTALLRRRPFFWENLFANDGPRNCKFLKLRPFDGREGRLKDLVVSWGFNMMNQAELSKIVFLASRFVLVDDLTPGEGYEKALTQLLSPAFAAFLRQHGGTFLSEGLDKLSEEQKLSFIKDLSAFSDPGAQEIRDYLEGKYLVGSECLTD